MGKKSGVKKNSRQALDYAAAKQNKDAVGLLKVVALTEQRMLDRVAIALKEEFGFGPERQKRFHDRFESVYGELSKIEREDSQDNEYLIEVEEKALQEALGKYYEPRDVRYDINIIDKYGGIWKV